jgi:hypothetical protein
MMPIGTKCGESQEFPGAATCLGISEGKNKTVPQTFIHLPASKSLP